MLCPALVVTACSPHVSELSCNYLYTGAFMPLYIALYKMTMCVCAGNMGHHGGNLYFVNIKIKQNHFDQNSSFVPSNQSHLTLLLILQRLTNQLFSSSKWPFCRSKKHFLGAPKWAMLVQNMPLPGTPGIPKKFQVCPQICVFPQFHVFIMHQNACATRVYTV